MYLAISFVTEPRALNLTTFLPIRRSTRRRTSNIWILTKD